MLRSLVWTAVLVPTAIVLALGCSDDEGGADGGCDGCGDDCASLAEGQWQVSGDPRLDDVFRAGLMIDSRLSEIEARTRVSVARLAEAFGAEIDPEGDLGNEAAIVADAMQAVFDDYVYGSMWSAGPCVADVPLAYAAEVACELHFGCDAGSAAATGGIAPAPVGCEGECRGMCEGQCAGVCLTPIDAGECDGACYGACDISTTPATCEGTCHGECSMECLHYDFEGQCAGPCNGACTGVCETLHDGKDCSGLCTGDCGVEVTAEVECVGGCIGTCDGACTGECSGPATPAIPEVAAECEMTYACQPVAALLSWAAPAPTWQEYIVAWSPNDELESWTAPELVYAFAVLDDELPALIAADAELRAIFGGGDYSIPAIGGLQSAVEGLIEADLEELDIPECKIPCVIDALESLSEIMTDIASRSVPLVEAHAALLGVVDAE